MRLNNKYNQERIDYPGPFSIGPRKITNCVCPDGKLRNAHCSESGPDTFFSIPAKVYAKGKTVSGYITPDEYYKDNGERVTYWKFQPYTYRKNYHLVS